MRRGEIWIVDLEPTIGREQRGKRPVLVVSPDPINAAFAPIVCAITSGGAAPRATGLAVSLAACGTQTTGVVLCHQLRQVDTTARKGRRIEVVPDAVLADVLAKIAAIFEP